MSESTPTATVGGGAPPPTVAAPNGSGAWRRRKLRLRLPFDPLGVLGIGLLIGVWYAATLFLSRTLLPLPQEVIERIIEEFTSSPEMEAFGIQETGYLPNLIYTVENVVVSVTIGSIIGVIVGLASARTNLLRAALTPVVLVGGSVPILVAAPFFLIWFGTGRIVAYLIVGFYSVFMLIVFAQRAADNIDPVYEQNARTLGASSRQRFRTILIPAVLPGILGGVRIAFAAAWGLETIAELLGLPAGLGKVIQVYSTTIDTQGIFAAVLLLGVVALLTDVIAVAVLRRGFRWREP